MRFLGHLRSHSGMAMPGRAALIASQRYGKYMISPYDDAAVYLEAAFGQNMPTLPVTQWHAEQWPVMLQVARSGLHAPLTSSVGRLFDAVAALLGVRDSVSYEGQAAIELEQLADPAETAYFHAALMRKNGVFAVSGIDLIRAVVEALVHQVSPAVIAGRFHNGVAEAIFQGCQAMREHSGLRTVALSGGVFQNMLLLGRTVDRLEAQGFRVLHHRQVPPNDGGISLGQAVIAGRRSAPAR